MAFYEERKLWNEKIEILSRDEIRALQLEKLKKQVAYNYENSPFYKNKFEVVGAKPEDIKSFKDFSKIPLMTKDEHRRAQEESLEKYGNAKFFIKLNPKSLPVPIAISEYPEKSP